MWNSAKQPGCLIFGFQALPAISPPVSPPPPHTNTTKHDAPIFQTRTPPLRLLMGDEPFERPAMNSQEEEETPNGQAVVLLGLHWGYSYDGF